MTTIFLADIHLTDNPRDAHRWSLLPWVAQQVKKHKVDQVIVLGDLTEKKDRHTGTFVERLSSGVAEIAALCQMYFLKGNHDFVDPESPFFGFLRRMPNIVYFMSVGRILLPIASKKVRCLFLPSGTEEQWGGLKFNEFEWLFTHCTYRGCKMDNGMRAPGGTPVDVFGNFKGQVLSGDIHVPQRLGEPYGPEYIGAPYHIDFGDRYEPRALLIDAHGKKHDLYYPCPKKVVLDVQGPSDSFSKLFSVCDVGDQVKARVYLKRADQPEFPRMKSEIIKAAEKAGVELFGPSLHTLEERSNVVDLKTRMKINPEHAVREYAKMRGADGLTNIGIEILKDES